MGRERVQDNIDRHAEVQMRKRYFACLFRVDTRSHAVGHESSARCAVLRYIPEGYDCLISRSLMNLRGRQNGRHRLAAIEKPCFARRSRSWIR